METDGATGQLVLEVVDQRQLDIAAIHRSERRVIQPPTSATALGDALLREIAERGGVRRYPPHAP